MSIPVAVGSLLNIALEDFPDLFFRQCTHTEVSPYHAANNGAIGVNVTAKLHALFHGEVVEVFFANVSGS